MIHLRTHRKTVMLWMSTLGLVLACCSSAIASRDVILEYAHKERVTENCIAEALKAGIHLDNGNDQKIQEELKNTSGPTAIILDEDRNNQIEIYKNEPYTSDRKTVDENSAVTPLLLIARTPFDAKELPTPLWYNHFGWQNQNFIRLH